jgi:hypothetical protein
MDGHPGPQGLDRIPPTGRLTVNQGNQYVLAFLLTEESLGGHALGAFNSDRRLHHVHRFVGVHVAFVSLMQKAGFHLRAALGE